MVNIGYNTNVHLVKEREKCGVDQQFRLLNKGSKENAHLCVIPEHQLKLLTDIDFMTRRNWYDIVLKIVISVVAYLISHPWFTRVVVHIDILVLKTSHLLSFRCFF